MKRGWLALFIGVALLALAWPAALEAQTGGKVLRMAIPTDPLMNPIIGTDAAAVPVNRFLYGFLTRPDPDTLEPAPDLATKWEVSSDGLTWTFHLRRDVKWQDGQPFTADDVKFTYDTILDRKNNSPRRSAIADITAVTMVDRYTIRFTLSKPIAPFPSIGAYNVGIVPRHLLEGKDVARAGDFNTRQPLGTGPYRISEAAAGDHYTFVPNQHYFRGKPKLDRVIFKVLPDINTQVAQLKSGELDFAVVEPANLAAIGNAPNLRIDIAPFLGFIHLSFNSKDPFFNDRRVRLAMIHATDRDGIIKTVMQGRATRATGPIPPVFKWAYDPSLPYLAYDLEKARALLREAGWTRGPDGVLVKDGKRFQFTLVVDKGNPAREQSAVIAQQNYARAGMVVKLEVLEWPVYVRGLLGKTHQSHVGFWVLPPDPDLTNYYATDQAFNTVNYSNREIDALLAEGRAVADTNKRKAIYKKFQQAWVADPPGVILYYPQDIRVHSTRLSGVPRLPFREALQYIERWEMK